SNFGRLSFQGFYTVVFEKDEEIISAASLRIHGTKLAEMFFISTSEAYRCKGLCRKLMIAIEEALCYLSVENLIIPFVAERIQSWINGYGFSRLNLSMKKEIMAYNTLMFHDSVRLQKILPSSSNFNPHARGSLMGVAADEKAAMEWAAANLKMAVAVDLKAATEWIPEMRQIYSGGGSKGGDGVGRGDDIIFWKR
ncbi:hypothetical protein MIMGU_mgv1a0180902mg, partial [Erythranthe guttata]